MRTSCNDFFAIETIIYALMPVVPEKRKARGFVRKGAFYKAFVGSVPHAFNGFVGPHAFEISSREAKI